MYRSARRPLLALLALASPAAGQATRAQADAPQTQADSFTRYELEAPESRGGAPGFRILYDVSATTPGATHYFNTVRTGAEEEVHGVTDLHTGRPLPWDLVDGEEARRTGHPGASPEGRYIRVRLARPVPADGEGRVRIDKTYIDPESYLVEGDEITFSRSLGITRNAVVLPSGYELVGVNFPSQVAREDDGRIRVSFMNTGPGSVPYSVRARRLMEDGAAELRRPSLPVLREGPEPPLVRDDAGTARMGWEPPERAVQDREIVYYLQEPESHAFRLFHDYTETRPEVDRYLNVVRSGSAVSDPSAFNLDTGEALTVETVRGRAVAERGILAADRVDDRTEVVVIRFDPPVEGGSVRLRIWETYTDAGRYTLHGDELVWDRGFGRARNALVLPAGWMLTTSSLPAVVTETDDGRLRLELDNPRPDDLRVYVRARRRAGSLQATSLRGEPLRARTTDPGAVLEADRALAAAPDDPERLIAAARVRRDHWLYRDAMELYDRAIELAPGDWRPWRFRGHRRISTRDFGAAVADLERARELAPHSFDVAYHLGLAYYLMGRFHEAAEEYGRCLAMAGDARAEEMGRERPLGDGYRSCADIAGDDDTRVALTDWLWRSLRRAGRDGEAGSLLATVGRNMAVEANRAYHTALLVYGGAVPEADALADPGFRMETVGYGLAIWHLVEGREARARELLEEVAAHPHWPGFGRIAAEVDLARMEAGGR